MIPLILSAVFILILLIIIVSNKLLANKAKDRSDFIIKQYEENLLSRNKRIGDLIASGIKSNTAITNLSYYVSVLEAEIVTSKGRALPLVRRKKIEEYLDYLHTNNPKIMDRIVDLTLESTEPKRR